MRGTARTDAELLTACRQGHVPAFEQLVERYQSLVCGVCFSATGDWSVSEDLAQETFLAAWSSLRSLREPDRLRAWLCGIARNLSLKAARKARPELPLDTVSEAAAEETPLDVAMARETEALVWTALERIPPQYREPLVLFYQQGHTTQEIADALGLSEAAVHQRLSRGRRFLKDRVSALVERSLSGRRTRPGFAASIAAAVAAGGAGAIPRTALATAATKGAATMAWTKIGGGVAALALLLLAWRLGTTPDPAPSEVTTPSAAAEATPPGSTRSAPPVLPRVKPAASPARAPAVPSPGDVEPEAAEAEEREPFFTRLAIHGVRQDWAEGKLGLVLEPCLAPVRSAGLEVSFTLDFDGDALRAVRATGGDALGPKTGEVERCLKDKLDTFGISPAPGETPELEVQAAEQKGPPPFDREAFEATDFSTAPSRGPAGAPLTMTVFTGLRCVFCGTLLGTIDQLLDEYPRELRVVVKPIALLDEDVVVTEAAYAAQAQGKFWPVHDAMFADQDRLKPEILEELAKAAGLDVARFKADLAHGTFREQVEAERAEAKAMGVVGLPCVILGGERILGALPIEVFRARIDALLAARAAR